MYNQNSTRSLHSNSIGAHDRLYFSVKDIALLETTRERKPRDFGRKKPALFFLHDQLMRYLLWPSKTTVVHPGFLSNGFCDFFLSFT